MIKPCPFCGGSAKVGHEKYYQPRVSRRIICTVCFSSSGWYRTEEEAIEAWNRRSNNAPTFEAEPIRYGEWLPVDDKNDAFDCSECDVMVMKKHNYCPNYGAKMK